MLPQAHHNLAVDASGKIRTTGEHVIAFFPLAKAAAPLPPLIVTPGLPPDGTNYKPTPTVGLFNSIIVYENTNQGPVSDCYFLGAITGAGVSQPQTIKSQIIQLSASTYRCRFRRQGRDTWVTVTDELPSNAARINNNCKWVALYEKAYAEFRTGVNTYASLNEGFTGNAFNDIGWDYVFLMPGLTTDAAVAQALKQGLPVCIMTSGVNPLNLPLPLSHCEVIVKFDGVTYTAYNVWGFDGFNKDTNPSDGMVSYTALQSTSGIISAVVICTAYTPPDAFPTPTPEPTMNITVSATVPTTITADKASALVNCRVETVNGKPDIGYVTSAAYAEFALNVATSGEYTLTVNLSATVKGTANVSLNGTVCGGLLAKATGSWTTYATDSLVVTLPAGAVTIRIANVNGSQYNIGDITITPGSVIPVPAPTAAPKTASITAFNADGTITGTWK